MENATPLCGVVIVNWCGATDTIACWKSVVQSTYAQLEILVIDNASPDGSFDVMAGALSSGGAEAQQYVTLLRNDQNLGYAAANNRGIRECIQRGCEYVLVLNNDTLVAPDAIAALITVARRRPKAGLIGACIVDYTEPDRLQCLGGARLNRWLLRTRNVGEGESLAKMTLDFARRSSRVDYISGACVLVRREFFANVGAMREDLFLYGEELDWAIRARRAGWEQAVSPTAVVRHRSTTDEPRKREAALYYFVRNGLVLLRAYYPIALVSAFTAQLLRSVLLQVVGRGGEARAVRRGLVALLRGDRGAAAFRDK